MATRDHQKTLAIICSGGDCAGLNAVISAATDAATLRGWRVMGIKQGFHGLLSYPPEQVLLTPEGVRGNVCQDVIRIGGTVLRTTNRGNPYHYVGDDGIERDRSADIPKALEELGVDFLLVIGGDGSMRMFDALLKDTNVRFVGVPKTIDNDVPGTELCVGFMTAVEIVSDSLDKLASTAASHNRVMILETMGRDSGFLALFGGVAGGADVILTPEIDYDLDAIADHIKKLTNDRPGPILMVVAEGIKGKNDLVTDIEKKTNIETRATVLGHLQRGGSPVAMDRVMAISFGVHAVKMLERGDRRRMAAWAKGSVNDVSMTEVISGPMFLSSATPLIKTAQDNGIYVGQVIN